MKAISRRFAAPATTRNPEVNLERKRGKLDRMADEWLSGLTCSEASKATYLRTLRVWNNWLLINKHNNALGATRADVLDFRSFLISSKKSPHTVCSYLSIVRMFHKFLYLRGDKLNIASDIRGVKRQKYYNKRPLTDDQVVSMLGCIDVSTAIGRRDYMILMLMVRAGLHGDIVRMSVQDIERIAAKRMKAAGVTGEGISAHSLRHTFGCQLVSAGVPINQVQSLMGHNSIDATMIYVKMAADRKLFADNPANCVKLPQSS